MRSDWEEVKKWRNGRKDFKKFKGKMIKRYLIEGFYKSLNPKIDKYDNGYEQIRILNINVNVIWRVLKGSILSSFFNLYISDVIINLNITFENLLI